MILCWLRKVYKILNHSTVPVNKSVTKDEYSQPDKKEKNMKKVAFLSLCGMWMLAITGCQPTVATISVSETIGPNGEKTVTTRKTLSQVVNHTQTGSTDQILEKYK